jgi:outer membrane protein assembly factor BamB
MTVWGDLAIPAHRFLAFDKRTGKTIWLMSTRLRPEDTTYSTPTITTFNGQAAMVFGAGDGSVYALQPRTGKVIWTYDASTRGFNTPPLVSDGIVYCGHGEQNATDTTVLGAVFALDGRRTGHIAEDQLLWKIPARTVSRSQPLLVDGRLYVIEDGGTMSIIDAATGRDIGQQKVGRIVFGSMVYADGRIYVGEATGRWFALAPTEDGVRVLHQVRLNNEEILGSMIVSHGRIYLPTNGALYCIGKADWVPAADPVPKPEPEAAAESDRQPAQIQLVPAETMVSTGDRIEFQVRAYNARGQLLGPHQAKLTLEGPGSITDDGQFTAATGNEHSTVIVTATSGEMTATSRVRVIPPLPWKFDFNDDKVPMTWIGAAYRHQPRKVDGESMLVKVTTIPKGTRSRCWMGPTNLHDYTVQADLMGTERNQLMPEMGLINQRYVLAMQPSQKLQIRSWASRLELRFAKTIPFEWKPNEWYTMKFQCSNRDGKAELRGKVWPRGSAEPSQWSIEAADAAPNTAGSPGMFGNSSDAEFMIDNVQVTPNEAAKL